MEEHDLGMQVWEVVAVAADATGVIVREGVELTSGKVSDRLCLRAKVRQLDLQAERLQFRLLAGRGPETGWVSVRVRDKDLLRRTDWQPSAAHALDADHYLRSSNGGLDNPCGDLLSGIYTAALEYEVVNKVVAIRKSPSTKAPIVGKLESGSKVCGFLQGDWLKLCEAPSGWMLVNGDVVGLGTLLSPRKFKLDIQRTVAEAVRMRFDRLPAKVVRYRIEWSPQDDPKDMHSVVPNENEDVTVVHSLPPSCEIRFRIVASVMSADEADGGRIFAQLASDWELAETEDPIESLEEEQHSLDTFANFRGRCGGCSFCDGYVMAREVNDSMGINSRPVQNLDDLLCRRCGCSVSRHSVIGELQAAGRRPATKMRAPQSSKPASSLPAQPSNVEELKQQPALADTGAEWRTWRPEDAGEADRVKFVLDKIAQAASLFDTLGVAPTAEDKEIRSAYRRVSLYIHPDKVQNRAEEDLVDQAEAAFKIVSSAYDVLGDPSKRAAYQRSILRRTGGSLVSYTGTSGSRRDLTGISFLKKFLSKMKKDSGYDLKQKPKGDWEDQGGGVYTRSVGIKVTLKHAITEEEHVLRNVDRGTLLQSLKARIVSEVKRGPERRIELTEEDGTKLSDNRRVNASETIILIGISLGPPVMTEVCLSHAITGARLRLMVLDTASIKELRIKAAEKLACPAEQIRLGCRAQNTESFEQFDDLEFLNGRVQILLLGAEIEMLLTLEEAVELQTQLRDSYGAGWFQERLDALLDEYPVPQSFGNRDFREKFADLAQKAQHEVLLEHGFDGPKGVINMYKAFRDVGHHPECVALTLEIDQKLRITQGGMLPQVNQITLEPCGILNLTIEKVVFIHVALQPCFSFADYQPPVFVSVPAGCTVAAVHEAAAQRLCADLEEFQLVEGDDFEVCDPAEPVGECRSFKVLGKDLPSPEEGETEALLKEETQLPLEFSFTLPAPGATVGLLRQWLAHALAFDNATKLQLLCRDSLRPPEDTDLVYQNQKFRLHSSAFPRELPAMPKLFEQRCPGDAALKLVLRTQDSFRDLREAAAQKLGVTPARLLLLCKDSFKPCGDDEPIGSNRKLWLSGVEEAR